MLKKDVKKAEKEDRSLRMRCLLSIILFLIIVAILIFYQIAENKEKSEIQTEIKVVFSKNSVENKNQKNDFEIFDFKKSNNFVALKIPWLSNIYWSQNINVVVKEKMSSINVAEFQAEYQLFGSKTAEISFLLNPKLSFLFRGLNKKQILEKYLFKIRPENSTRRVETAIY